MQNYFREGARIENLIFVDIQLFSIFKKQEEYCIALLSKAFASGMDMLLFNKEL